MTQLELKGVCLCFAMVLTVPNYALAVRGRTTAPDPIVRIARVASALASAMLFVSAIAMIRFFPIVGWSLGRGGGARSPSGTEDDLFRVQEASLIGSAYGLLGVMGIQLLAAFVIIVGVHARRGSSGYALSGVVLGLGFLLLGANVVFTAMIWGSWRVILMAPNPSWLALELAPIIVALAALLRLGRAAPRAPPGSH